MSLGEGHFLGDGDSDDDSDDDNVIGRRPDDSDEEAEDFTGDPFSANLHKRRQRAGRDDHRGRNGSSLEEDGKEFD
jgi:hypothetical protein